MFDVKSPRLGQNGPHKAYRDLAVVSIGVILLSLISSCAVKQAQSDARGTNSARIPAYPLITEWTQVKRPVDKYLPSAEQEVQLARLRFSRAQACLKSRGYVVHNLEPASYPAFVRGESRDLVVRADAYGFFDTQFVARYGYVRPPSIPGHVILNPPKGVPYGLVQTCEKLGFESIESSSLTNLPGGGPATLQADDPQLHSLVSKWVACMATSGFKVADPISVIGDHLTSNVRDIAVARADVSCKQTTNFVGVATGLQAKIDNKYLQVNGKSLQLFSAAVKRLLTS